MVSAMPAPVVNIAAPQVSVTAVVRRGKVEKLIHTDDTGRITGMTETEAEE